MSAFDFDYRNVKLLWDLMRELGAKEPGDLHGFMETRSDWHCRACLRSKAEIARLDGNKNLLCRIVWHHDHIDELMPDEMQDVLRRIGFGAQSTSRMHVVRFPPELICQDCNVAEGAAKKHVQARKPFSFAPHEISLFIDVSPNIPHFVDFEVVDAVYAELRPILNRLAKVVSAIPKRYSNVDDWQHVSAPLERLLAKAARKPS